jgi:PTS system nitrogen regulatory IIA component
MPFLDLLTLERVRTDLVASDKAELLVEIAALMAGDPAEEGEILEALQVRERLGSTGLGRGVAIPHGRIAGIERARAAFIKLKAPMAFDAVDSGPIDLVAALVVPSHFTDQHLHLLAELAELFSDERLTTALRNADDPSAIIAELAEFGVRRPRESAWTD